MIIFFDRILGVLSRTVNRTAITSKIFSPLDARESDIQKITISLKPLISALRVLITFVRTSGELKLVLLRIVDKVARIKKKFSSFGY